DHRPNLSRERRLFVRPLSWSLAGMSLILTETRGHVLIVTLNRPEARNAFNRAMAVEMETIVDAYEADAQLHAAIIQANGPTFSAGQDLIAAARGEMAATPVRGGFGIMSKPPVKPLLRPTEGAVGV